MKNTKRTNRYNFILILFIIFCFAPITHDKSFNNHPSIQKIFSFESFAQEKEPKTKYFTLNFKDADITEFLNMMSQLINKNIIIDDKVRGKITITSVKKIPVSHAYQIMMSILEVKGLAAVETPSLIKIIPVKDAIKKNSEIIIDGKKHNIKTEEEKTITYLLNIKTADANEIANALRSLKSNNLDIVVYASLNTIILSGVSSEIDGLVKIAQELDKEIKEKADEKISSGNIHVVHLENADAEQLAGVLSRIPFSENAKISQPSATPTSPVNPTPTATPGTRVRPSTRTQRTTQTQRTTTGQAGVGTKLSIIANKETNSIIIYATPEEFKEIYRIIKELDIVREQVLIEALIVEVSADKSWTFGIDWMLGNSSGGNSYGGSAILGKVPNFNANKDSVPSGKTTALPLSQGFQVGFLSGKDALGFALLSMSETDKNFNILSTPQLLTIDNHEAELNIGSEIPVTANSRITDTNTVFNTYEYKSVGLKLKITPHITKSSSITLDLYQEANDILGATNSETLPTLTKRDIQTKVSVQDGKTIVIGGLIKNNKNVEETKIPLLGDIPILGWLFKRQSVSYTKSNLLVFITPHIVTKSERIDAITEQKQEEMKRSKIK
ncbi:MAG: secretin N-terminal domain-containing protein [Spirochaetota bacterium]